MRRLEPLRGTGRSLLARSLDDWDREDRVVFAAHTERLVEPYRATALGG